MATLSPTKTRAHLNNLLFFHHRNPSLPSISPPFNPLRSSSLSLLRTNPNSRLRRCLAAAGPGPPPSPPESNRNRASGLAGSASRLQDRIQIFLAVLFWMSLFFWASAWDGRSGGRSNKGSRNRR